MSSLLTNTSAMTALQALTSTQNSLSKTENQISTGLRISTAADNSSYWSIATKMTSDVGALGAVSDSLSESSALVSTMSSALTATVSVMDTIKDDLVSAQEPGADLSKIQTDISAQQTLLQSIAKSSSFNGINYLATTSTTSSLVAAYSSTTGVSTIAVDLSNTALFGAVSTAGVLNTTAGLLGTKGSNYSSASIVTLDVSSASTSDIGKMLLDVEKALGSIETGASTLGATQTSISTQQSFISNLSSSLTTGIGSLVDADMNEASTKLAALQVQQQLGIQALSIANQNTQTILKLFGG